MREKIPDEICGAWIAHKNEILSMNNKAKAHGWGANFQEENLERIVDGIAHHLLVPLLVNHPKGMGERGYRCLLWLKVATKDTRIATLMDWGEIDIKSLRRPSEKGLHGIIGNLVELQLSNTLINLDTYDMT